MSYFYKNEKGEVVEENSFYFSGSFDASEVFEHYLQDAPYRFGDVIKEREKLQKWYRESPYPNVLKNLVTVFKAKKCVRKFRREDAKNPEKSAELRKEYEEMVANEMERRENVRRKKAEEIEKRSQEWIKEKQKMDKEFIESAITYAREKKTFRYVEGNLLGEYVKGKDRYYFIINEDLKIRILKQPIYEEKRYYDYSNATREGLSARDLYLVNHGHLEELNGVEVRYANCVELWEMRAHFDEKKGLMLDGENVEVKTLSDDYSKYDKQDQMEITRLIESHKRTTDFFKLEYEHIHAPLTVDEKIINKFLPLRNLKK